MLQNHKLYFALKVPDYDTFIVHDEPEVVPEPEVAAGAAVPEAAGAAGAAGDVGAAGAAANVGAAVPPSDDENRNKAPLESSQRHEVQ